MPNIDHKQQLTNFINSLTSRLPQAKIDALKSTLLGDEELVVLLAEGFLAQSDYSRRVQEVGTYERDLANKQQQWNTYIASAQTTLTQSERARLVEAQRASAAETAIKALASQYNIPEEDVRAVYTFDAARGQGSQGNGNGGDPNNLGPGGGRQTDPNLNKGQTFQSNALTEEVLQRNLYGLVQDMSRKDACAAKHFTLTGKLWDSSKALAYITEQARLGNQIEIEQAWRITENIDSLEAVQAAAVKTAERAALRTEIEQELAAKGTLPNDPNPNFGEAKISNIFTSNVDKDGKQVEQTGHYGRTREATSAIQELLRRRALGQKSQYEEPANTGG